jgi:uncharacterized Zn-finger protein
MVFHSPQSQKELISIMELNPYHVYSTTPPLPSGIGISGILPNQEGFIHSMLPAPNEIAIQHLVSEIQNDDSELRFLDGTNSTSMLLQDMSRDEWSVLQDDSSEPSSLPRPNPYFNVEQKVFGCVICSKNFSRRKRLNSHMTTHSEVRPYKCSLCDKSFKRAHHIKRHAKGCKKSLAMFIELN